MAHARIKMAFHIPVAGLFHRMNGFAKFSAASNAWIVFSADKKDRKFRFCYPPALLIICAPHQFKKCQIGIRSKGKAAKFRGSIGLHHFPVRADPGKPVFLVRKPGSIGAEGNGFYEMADMAASKKQFCAFCQKSSKRQSRIPGRGATQSSCSFTKLRTARDPIL